MIYVRSTDGNNADNGSTWALAKATITGAAGIDVAGDVVNVSQSHAESTAGTVSPNWAGTLAAPTKVICVNDSAEPPTAVATGASVTSTTTSLTLVQAGVVYYRGIDFICGSTTNSPVLSGQPSPGSGVASFESCNFRLAGSGSSGRMEMQAVKALNCGFRLANAAQYIGVGMGTRITGGSVLSGGTSPTALFKADLNSSFYGDFVIEGFDLSNCSAGVHLFDCSQIGLVTSGKFVNCKLPVSWSGSLCASTARLSPSQVIELINCASGAVNYAYWRQTAQGSLRHETVIVRSGGARFGGATPISWKMASTTNVSFPANGLVSQPLYARVTTTGSPITASVEVLTDNVTLTDAQCYLEVMYLSSSGAPLYTRVADCKADIIATAANQTSSSETWTTTGLSTPIKQKLSVTFTPQMAGFVMGRVYLHRSSTTVYVDPRINIS